MGLCWQSQVSWATRDLLLHWCSSTLTVVGALHQLLMQLLHVPSPTHAQLSLTDAALQSPACMALCTLASVIHECNESDWQLHLQVHSSV